MPRTEDGLRWLWLAGRVGRAFIWDDDALGADRGRRQVRARPADRRARRTCRSRSALACDVHLFAGELSAAASLVEQRTHRRGDGGVGHRPAPYGALALARFSRPRGRGARLAHRDQHARSCIARGEGDRPHGVAVGDGGALQRPGRYEDAFAAAALRAPRIHTSSWFSTWAHGRADRGRQPRAGTAERGRRSPPRC